jgi:hypothetical protein
MLRLLPLLLALLAACQVDVEGAPCRLGYPEDCPAGQGCGLDERCSTRCEKDDAPGCRCPPNDGPEFAADPAGSRALDVAPYPTGVESPVACRFGRLGDALAAAATYAAAHPEGGAVARAYGNTPVTFGFAETGEAFPLDIVPGVILSTAAPARDPASWMIRADTSSSSVVTLHDGATIEGVTISSVSAAEDVVRLSCASRRTATLRDVVVDGGRVAARGVTVSGPCDVEATELSITRAKGTGLHADVDLASVTEPVTGVTISGGAISDNGGNGAEVRAGRLGLLGTATRPIVIASNGGFGVVAKARDVAAVALALDLEFADVSLNGEAGVVVRNLQKDSSATIRFTHVHENKASTASSETVVGRRAGGAIISGNPAVPLTIVGNRFFSNRYDQLAVLSSATWNLSGGNCNGGANVFACHDSDPDHDGKLIYAFGAQQTVGNAQWSSIPPDQLLVNILPVVPCPEQSRVPAECPAIP